MTITTAIAAQDAETKTSYTEEPLDVDAGTGLFGILTRSEQSARDTGFIFLNAGLLHRVGPFRLYVDVARRIAELGYSSIRLDQSGKGDSNALPNTPLAEATVANLTAAANRLREETGATRFVIGGLCSGADDALAAGPDMDNLAGLFMFDGYTPKTSRYFLQRFGPKLLSPGSWISRARAEKERVQRPEGDIGNLRNWGTPREMAERYRTLVDRGVLILAVYTGWGGNFYTYPQQLIGSIKHPQAEALVSELHIPEATHLFPVSAHRARAVDGIAEWTERSFTD